jgi:hypothetical protein
MAARCSLSVDVVCWCWMFGMEGWMEERGGSSKKSKEIFITEVAL